MKTMIVAFDQQRTIGRNGDLPWARQMQADARHFRSLTEGTSVIMGRKTFDSLPEKFRPLPRRQNIVVSLGMEAVQGVTIAHSLEEAYDFAEHDIMIIGGGQIYEQALPDVDVVLATEIETTVEDGDTFFPELPEDEWFKKTSVWHPHDVRNRYAYSFSLYVRRYPNLLGE